jgi:(p)ppGpp synthase/HD superfamily hydrolase
MIAFEAMVFARQTHATQVRRYTGNPYADHLAEVAGIVSTVASANAPWDVVDGVEGRVDRMIATAWLHDCVEDQGVTESELAERFGTLVARGVMLLSDLEQGNRAERKAASRLRLSAAPGWVQSIKVADLISNTSSIVQNDPKFAVTYLEEKRLLLDVLTHADDRLIAVARNQIARAS